jgi:tRNA(adenine34) deaminase
MIARGTYGKIRSLSPTADEQFMGAALELAREARERGEVPVGAVLVMDGEIVGRGFNQPVSLNDPTAHAEIVALRQAGREIGNYRLPGSTMYVTIEPCQMCVGAMVHARVARVVYGTPEPKAGAIESAMRAHEHPSLNHRLEVTGRVLEAECREVIQAFFRSVDRAIGRNGANGADRERPGSEEAARNRRKPTSGERVKRA